MRTGNRPSLRGGFTLIELLVVIGILALLAALSVGIIGSVRLGQLNATTESTVKKLQVAVNQQLSATVDEATKKGNVYFDPLKNSLAEADDIRIRSLLTYAYSKRNFPTNFREAKTPIAGVPADSLFNQVNYPTSLTSVEQSAALLYLIVHEKAARGTTVDGDAAFAGMETTFNDTAAPTKSYKGYKDAFGTPIILMRWYGAGDPVVQAPPYAVGPNADPFDRQGKLFQSSGVGNWTIPGNRAVALNGLNLYADIPTAFDQKNRVITVVSAGPDKTFGTADDVFGFRLAQFGGKN